MEPNETTQTEKKKEIIFVSKTHKYLLVLETKKRQKEDGVSTSGKHIEFNNFLFKTFDLELVERLKKLVGFGVNFWIMDKEEVDKLKLEDKTLQIGLAGMDSDSETNSRVDAIESKVNKMSSVLSLIADKLEVNKSSEAPVNEKVAEPEQNPEEQVEDASAEEQDDKK